MCEIREVNHVNEDSEDFGFFGIFGIFEKLEFTLDVVESQSTKIKRTLKQISYLFTFDNLSRCIFSICAVTSKRNLILFDKKKLFFRKNVEIAVERGRAVLLGRSGTSRNNDRRRWLRKPRIFRFKVCLLVLNFVCFVFLKCLKCF